MDEPGAPVGERYALDEAEIDRRLRFLEFSSQDAARLRAVRPQLEPYLPELAEALYDHIQTLPALGALLAGHVTQCRLKQSAYLQRLLEAEVDPVYTVSRSWVGRLHLHMGVEPRWYMAAYCVLQERIAERLAGLPELKEDPGEAWRVARSLGKLVFFDMILALDAYYADLLERQRAQRAALAELARPLVLEVLPGVSVLPLVGPIEGDGRETLRGSVLQGIARAQVLIIELGRLSELDAETGAALEQVVADAEGFGVRCLLSGLLPALQGVLSNFPAASRVPVCERLRDAVAAAQRYQEER